MNDTIDSYVERAPEAADSSPDIRTRTQSPREEEGVQTITTPFSKNNHSDIRYLPRRTLSMSVVQNPPRLRVINSAALLQKAQTQLQAAKQAALWDLHLVAGEVTLIAGQTSAGKTTLLHNLAYRLAEGKEFLGIIPPRRLKVLYADFESHDGVLRDHLAAIGTSPNLDFMDLDDPIRGPDLIKALWQTIKERGYEVVVIDPLIDAYPVENENDNAEANEQMVEFRNLARQTGAAVVLVHNVGRGFLADTKSPFYGRGATARPDRADIGINFSKAGNGDRKLYVAKSRHPNQGKEIEFRFAGNLSYELINAEAEVENELERRARQILAEATQSSRREIDRETLRTGLGLSKDDKDEKKLTRLITKLGLKRLRKGVFDPVLPSATAGEQPEAGVNDEPTHS